MAGCLVMTSTISDTVLDVQVFRMLQGSRCRPDPTSIAAHAGRIDVRRRVESRRAAHGRVLPAFGYRFEPAASARPRGIRSLWRRRAPTTRKPAPTVRAHRGRAFVRWGPATDAGGRQLTNLIES